MSKDMRVMVIKLADRLHNMRTLDSMSEEKKILKAKETSELHAPIARRLGLHSIGVELDDLCFKTLHPRKHIIIERKIKPSELSEFKGCFLTGTAAEVTPVSQIDKYKFDVCDVIKDLSESYQKLVRRKK